MERKTNQNILKFLLVNMIIFTSFFQLSSQITTTTVKGRTSINTDDFYFVSILSLTDSVVLDYRYFDTPDFMIEHIKSNEFILQISSPLLYKTYSCPVQNLRQQTTVDIGFIQLEPQVQSIDEITVTAMLPKVKFTEGRLVYDIQSNLDFKTLNSLEDILKRLPFVTVEENNINVFGKKNTLVLVNGLPPKNDNWEMISPDEIKNIEVITNPPAEYNATGMAVVNIITKKRFTEGFNGQLSTSLMKGEYWRSNNAIQLGYATRKLNFYTRMNYNPYKRLFSEDYERSFSDGNKMLNNLEQERTAKNNHNLVAGFDYILHPKHLVGLQYQRTYQHSTRHTQTITDLWDNSGQRYFETWTHVGAKTSKNIYDMNYTFEMDSTGKRMDFGMGYVDYSSEEDTDIEESVLSDKLFRTKESISIADIHLFTANIDYLHKTKDGFTGKAGLYLSHNKNNSKYDLSDNEKEIDTDLSNGAKIDETKLAGYLSGRKNWDKWYVAAGLRFEHVRYSNSDREGNKKEKTYNNLYPSLELGYDINDKIQTNLSFTRKVYYPAFQDLDPSVMYVDTLTYYKGNTNLRPQYSYNTEWNIIYNRFIHLSLGYSKIDDAINRFFVERLSPTSMICFATTENLQSQETWNASLTVPFQYKRWTMQNALGMNHNKVAFESEGLPIEYKKTMVYLYSYQGLKLPEGFNLSAIYQFNSSGLEGVFFHQKRHILNLALNKSFLNEQLIVSLRYDDVFKGDKQKTKIDLHDVRSIQTMTYDASYVTLSLRYTFGKSTKKYIIKENSKEELKRIN